jgi:O-antigen ligase
MKSDPAGAAELHQGADGDAIQAWLEALSTGKCDEDGFLRAVQKLTRSSPDAGWYSLSLVDQYYRRGRIATEVFNSLKSRLATQLVGPGTQAEVNVPPPQYKPPASAQPPRVKPAPRSPSVRPAKRLMAKWVKVARKSKFPALPLPFAPRPSAEDEKLVPTFGVFCLLAFCFVSFSQKLPLGAVAAVGAIIAAALRGKQFVIPSYYWWYLGYVAIGTVGWVTTNYRSVVSEQLDEVIKIALIGIAVCNVIYTPRSGRTFVVWYLALFALYPVRGALYNYIFGFTEFGRIAWNFFFRNPNDLAMTCFLPLGLCAYVIFVEKNKWIRWSAWVGVVVITGVQMLTQSRGAILALGAGILYFALHTKRTVRTLLVIGVLCTVAVAATPSHVWYRIAGLSKLSSGDMSQVDPEGSAAGRSMLMHLAWQTALHHPVFGIGLGAYAYENARITRGNPSVGRDERGERDAHSTYIRAAAETGMVGGLCVLLTVLASIAYCRACRKRVPERDDANHWGMALLALEASMVAYALGATVNSAERSTYFMLQFVIPCVLGSIVAPEKRPSKSTPAAGESDRIDAASKYRSRLKSRKPSKQRKRSPSGNTAARTDLHDKMPIKTHPLVPN